MDPNLSLICKMLDDPTFTMENLSEEESSQEPVEVVIEPEATTVACGC